MRLPTKAIITSINDSNKSIEKAFKQIDINNHYHVLFNYFTNGKLSSYDKEYLLDFYNVIKENINNKSVLIARLITTLSFPNEYGTVIPYFERY